MSPRMLWMSACFLMSAMVESAWARPPSDRNDTASACPLAKSWTELDVSVEGKQVNIGNRTFSLKEQRDRERLLAFADKCEAQTQDDKWVKNPKKATAVLTAVSKRFQEIVDEDRRWFRDRSSACVTQSNLPACMEIAGATDELPAWLRGETERSVSTAARTTALTLLEQASKSAVEKCVAETRKRPAAVDATEIASATATCGTASATLATQRQRLVALQATDSELGVVSRFDATMQEAATALSNYQQREAFLAAHAECLKEGAEDPCAKMNSLKAFGTQAEVGAANVARGERIKKDAETRRLQAEREAEEARRAKQAEARAVEILSDAEAAAKTRIYRKLRAPSTATLQAELKERKGFCYAYKVTVDAQNGFGAYIRSEHCVVVKIKDPWDKPDKYFGQDDEYSTYYGCSTKMAYVCDPT